MTTRRIGILGGTFDPIHCGHLDVGRAAEAALGLTEIVVIASNIPPHRPQPVASSYHRFAMVALAIGGREGWRASDLELRVGSPSFTTGTLQHFHDRGFAATELFFIIGADAFAEIESWKDFPAILDRAHFAVVSRPGFPVSGMPGRLPALAARMTGSSDAARIHHVRDAVDLSDRCADRRCVSHCDPPTGPPRASRSPGWCRRRFSQHIEQHALYSAHQFRTANAEPMRIEHPRQAGCMAKTDKRRKSARLPGAGCRTPSAPPKTRRRPTSSCSIFARRPVSPTSSCICSGGNPRQIRAIADSVMAALADEGVKPAHVEGYDRSEWVLLDYFDFIVHVFAPETRLFYGLERLWGNAERVEVPTG